MRSVCIDARQLASPTGIGVYLRSLLPHFKQAPLRLHLLVRPGETHPLTAGCTLHTVHAPLFSLREQQELPRLIPEVDLFFSPHVYIPWRALRARKRVVTVHDLFYFSPFAPRLKGALGRAYVRRAAQVSSLLTVSAFTANEIRRRVKREARVIPNGGDHLQELPEEKLPGALPRDFLLFVGRPSVPYKNFKGALAAAALLHEEGRALPLVVTGEVEPGPLRAGRAQVHFLGAVTDGEMVALYRRAKALLFPSFYEGFGLPPLEAMAFRCPVIASDLPSLREIAGETLAYIDPTSPRSIADAVGRLSCEQVPLAAERASHFSWKKSAESHLNYFEELLSS